VGQKKNRSLMQLIAASSLAVARHESLWLGVSGTADQAYLDEVASKMAVLNAVAATATLQWKPGPADPGALFTVAAELDAGE
jgi:hypothetical protein